MTELATGGPVSADPSGPTVAGEGIDCVMPPRRDVADPLRWEGDDN